MTGVQEEREESGTVRGGHFYSLPKYLLQYKRPQNLTRLK